MALAAEVANYGADSTENTSSSAREADTIPAVSSLMNSQESAVVAPAGDYGGEESVVKPNIDWELSSSGRVVAQNKQLDHVTEGAIRNGKSTHLLCAPHLPLCFGFFVGYRRVNQHKTPVLQHTRYRVAHPRLR